MSSSTGAGAQASYRGYRLQALYTLERLLGFASQPNVIVQPEGREDVDIIVDGTLIETIQVKSYPTLNFSHLTAGKKAPLVSRIMLYLRDRPKIQITVANFGAIGQELSESWRGVEPYRSSIGAKLESAGCTPADQLSFFSQVRLVGVVEGDVRDRIRTALEDQPGGMDPDVAFDLLTFWLYQRAETRSATTREHLMEQLTRIGRFLAECRTHHQEWFTSINPLEDTNVADTARLRAEFYEGIAARYEHILAGLDIPRQHLVDKVHSSWRSTNVVIVRAASGQGKTTLALRYIHDYYPGRWRFKIELIQDRRHALQVARALSGFASSVEADMIVYIDVSPRDVDWPELVQRLTILPNIRVLVTIREEDFQRAELSGVGFSYADMSLTFDRAEASLLYDQSSAIGSVKRFVDFEEAWSEFGERGPLIEFVYLLTQMATLRQRLASQLKRIRSEISSGSRNPTELKVLEVVSVATAYEARVNVRDLQRVVGHPDLAACLAAFEKEFLVRLSQDGIVSKGCILSVPKSWQNSCVTRH